MKKIAFYINVLSHGGAERVIANLAAAFQAGGYDCTVITTYPNEGEYPLSAGVHRISLFNEKPSGNRLVRNVHTIRRLRRALKTFQPAVLIAAMAEPNFRAVLAAEGLGIKTILSVCSDPDREYAGFVYRLGAKLLFPRAAGTVFQTREAQSWFPLKVQARSAILMNQIDPRFYETRQCSEKNYFVATGRLVPPKNYPVMLRAFARVLKAYPQEKLCIFGEGELKDTLQALIQSYGAENSIRLMGSSENIPEALSAAKGFLLSSDYEGMPNGLLEAMAMGLPCISTDCPCGGPREVIHPMETAFLCLLAMMRQWPTPLYVCLKMRPCDPAWGKMHRKQRKPSARNRSSGTGKNLLRPDKAHCYPMQQSQKENDTCRLTLSPWGFMEAL